MTIESLVRTTAGGPGGLPTCCAAWPLGSCAAGGACSGCAGAAIPIAPPGAAASGDEHASGVETSEVDDAAVIRIPAHPAHARGGIVSKRLRPHNFGREFDPASAT